ncbi:MAG: hypothetical protein MUP47_06065 [Phycisphaerae bacterium]|nr:hypothetical protein [Phycisphaerae bacterium]
MRRITLMTLTVLASVSLSPAAVVYDFNNLPVQDLHTAADGTVVWTALSSRTDLIQVVADPSDASNHLLQAASTRTEQVISVPVVPGSSLFGLSAQDTHFSLSYAGTMSDVSGFLVGLWMDGVDGRQNGSSSSTIGRELALQFGVDAASGAWRVVGANGANDVRTSALGLASGLPAPMTVTLEVDLLGNSGNGSATLTVLDLATNTTYAPYVGLSLGLLANPGYTDPSRYTGWYVRNTQVDASPQPGTQLYPATLDNLAMTALPEPASVSMILAGGLIFVARRRMN